jgi:cell division protein FtsB
MRGRNRLLLWLLLFLGASSAAVWRRVRGVATVRELRVLEDRMRALRTEVVTLRRELRTAERAVPAEASRRLGMHVAGELETRFLKVTAQAVRDREAP